MPWAWHNKLLQKENKSKNVNAVRDTVYDGELFVNYIWNKKEKE